MRYLIVMVAVCAVGCGNPGPKTEPIKVNNDPANTNPNGEPNNIVVTNAANQSANGQTGPCAEGQKQAEVNGEVGCYDECDAGACGTGFRCVSGLCVSDGELNGMPNGDPNNLNAMTTCSTNADCRVDQECKPVGCVDHISCDSIGGAGDCFVSPWGEWERCDDGKAYRVDCDDQQCSCIVNDTVVSSFFSDETACFEEPSYRVANRECDWTVPEN